MTFNDNPVQALAWSEIHSTQTFSVSCDFTLSCRVVKYNTDTFTCYTKEPETAVKDGQQ